MATDPTSKPIARSVAKRLAASIASSVAAPPSLYPILPDLFEGVESLGARPRAIVSLLRSAPLPRPARILDLACGKGSVSLALARAFDARVLGIDACAPFIDHATARAAHLRLADQTLFETGDVHALLSTRPKPRDRFDVVIMLNLLPASAAAPLVRQWTAPGGLYLVDDAVRAPSAKHDSAFDDVPTATDVAAAITRSGDTVLVTRITTPAEHNRLDSRLRLAISRNITRLIPRHPRLAADLRQYRRDQREAAALLAGPLRGAMWLVRRGDP